jgi:hypothetical protein
MPAAKLEKIPGFSQGVRVNAAQRMLKMNRPVCPNSKVEMEWDRNGKPIAKEKGPDTQNCQMAGGRWWEACEAAGHDPYFMTRKWETKEDILEPEVKDGKPTGRLLKTGEAIIPHESRLPNLAQVAVSIRINNGRGALDAVNQKGFRSLKAAGFEDVCEFRNCQKPKTAIGTSRQYGGYCSKEHLQLIAADAESIMLTQGSLLPVDAKRAQQKRAAQLREISVGTIE